MSKKCKKAPSGISFSGVLSATNQIQPESVIPNTSIPEQCRPLWKYNRLSARYFRRIVGHLSVESPTFAFGITGKGYGRKNN